MNLTDRIAEQLPKLPPEIRQLLDALLATGNEINDVEVGHGPEEGKIAIILNHPFKLTPDTAPAGIAYREITDRDPLIFEFYTADERFSLVTAKFKPMVLDTAFHGPVSPNEAHMEFMKKYNQEVEAAAAKRAAQMAASNPPRPRPPKVGDAGKRFLDSMKMTFDMWHDGTGYDLDALKELTPHERDAIETILINHHPRDWRDIEALAHIDSPKARQTIEAALKSSDPQVRQEAMNHAGEKADPADREKLLIQSLKNDSFYGGLSQAIDEVPDFHPPAVVEALLHGALDRDGEAAVHFAAVLFFLHDKAKEPFDWDHRPFFLRFNTADRAERKAVFRELCQIIGVDAKKYLET